MKNRGSIVFLILAALGGLFFAINTASASYAITDGSIKALYHAEDYIDATGNFSLANGEDFLITTSTPGGKFGEGFTGNSANVQAATTWAYNGALPMTNTDNFSVGAWIRLTAPTAHGCIVSLGSISTAGYSFYLGGADGSVLGNNLHIQKNNVVWIDTGYTISQDGNYHLVIFSMIEGEMWLTLDHINHNLGPMSLATPNDRFTIGNGWQNGQWTVYNQQNFISDEIFVKDTPITQEQSDGLWNSGAGNQISIPGEENFSIDLTSPVSTSTPILDFEFWRAYATTTDFSLPYRARVYYRPVSAGAFTWIDTTDYTSQQNYNPYYFVIDKRNLLPLLASSSTRNWQAYAALINASTSEEIASSSWIYFTITNFLYEGGGGSVIPSSTEIMQIICDPNSNWFQYSMCSMMLYLFNPGSDSLNKIGSVWDAVKNKPPFGYFAAIAGALGDLNSSAEAAFNFPDLSPLDSQIFSPLKTGLAWILWIVFGFWIFKKFRHIQL